MIWGLARDLEMDFGFDDWIYWTLYTHLGTTRNYNVFAGLVHLHVRTRVLSFQ
jgi:hypothetical protein